MEPKPRKPRDYAAEEERRRIRAVARGFTSRAQMRRMQEKGYYPSAAERRTKEGREKAERIEALLKEQRRADELSKQWSHSHSRQRVTEWSDRWSRKRKDAFYNAFVMWWDVPNDERDFQPTYDYMMRYGGVPPQRWHDDPYRNR